MSSALRHYAAQVLLEPHDGLMGSVVEAAITSASRWNVTGAVVSVVFRPLGMPPVHMEAPPEPSEAASAEGWGSSENKQPPQSPACSSGAPAPVREGPQVEAITRVHLQRTEEEPGHGGAACYQTETCSLEDKHASPGGSEATTAGPAGSTVSQSVDPHHRMDGSSDACASSLGTHASGSCCSASASSSMLCCSASQPAALTGVDEDAVRISGRNDSIASGKAADCTEAGLGGEEALHDRQPYRTQESGGLTQPGRPSASHDDTRSTSASPSQSVELPKKNLSMRGKETSSTTTMTPGASVQCRSADRFAGSESSGHAPQLQANPDASASEKMESMPSTSTTPAGKAHVGMHSVLQDVLGAQALSTFDVVLSCVIVFGLTGVLVTGVWMLLSS
jgi:hypothetical protein